MGRLLSSESGSVCVGVDIVARNGGRVMMPVKRRVRRARKQKKAAVKI